MVFKNKKGKNYAVALLSSVRSASCLSTLLKHRVVMTEQRQRKFI